MTSLVVANSYFPTPSQGPGLCSRFGLKNAIGFAETQCPTQQRLKRPSVRVTPESALCEAQCPRAKRNLGSWAELGAKPRAPARPVEIRTQPVRQVRARPKRTGADRVRGFWTAHQVPSSGTLTDGRGLTRSDAARTAAEHGGWPHPSGPRLTSIVRSCHLRWTVAATSGL